MSQIDNNAMWQKNTRKEAWPTEERKGLSRTSLGRSGVEYYGKEGQIYSRRPNPWWVVGGFLRASNIFVRVDKATHKLNNKH